jgi:hypothetical protein
MSIRLNLNREITQRLRAVRREMMERSLGATISNNAVAQSLLELGLAVAEKELEIKAKG